MNTWNLPSLVTKSKRRIGRGHGSGRVKTSGRGTKGQNARKYVKIGFEGGQLPLTRRLPLLRGKLRNKGTSPKPRVIAVSLLNGMKSGTKVTREVLIKEGIISPRVQHVKLVGDDQKLTVSLTVMVPCTAKAKNMIEQAGGQLLVEKNE